MTSLRGEWLAAFVAVVEARSFTDAAKRLCRTQSAVSMQIGQLELATGQSLLLRQRHGVIPSAAGERLLPHARRSIQALHDAASLFDDAEASGPLRVGIPEEYAGTAWPKLLGNFQRSQPRVELSVTCASSDRIEAAMDQGTLDLGILVADDDRRSGETLLHDPTWWVMAETLELPESSPLPLVLFDQACWWRQAALDRVGNSGHEWRIAYTSDSIAGVAAAIQAGLGIGVLGRSTLPAGVQPVPTALGLPDLPGSRLVLSVTAPDAPGATAMINLIRQHFSFTSASPSADSVAH
ncbi:LysR family transcriptional regulator [Halomonas halmophila]|uniref:LysR family transcriptional regulator n=1 Tax=Halomonas halmophila TaxID=252 RepID=A0A4Y4F3A0_9GAMM|nr:LysR family transcriptional regulator [Halomonas halmophila]GED22324.1 LysR family transcriptional regulator [Halomonas halmophila]